jgi:hypothetical protein
MRLATGSLRPGIPGWRPLVPDPKVPRIVKGGGPERRQDGDDDGRSLPRPGHRGGRFAMSRCAVRSSQGPLSNLRTTQSVGPAPPRTLQVHYSDQWKLTYQVVSRTGIEPAEGGQRS